MAGQDGGGGDDSISKQFDTTYKSFKAFEAEFDSTSEKSKNQIDQHIKEFEYLTVKVSELDLFSSNEAAHEINPSKLKFLLLPYLLGVLWQMKVGCDRGEVCRITKIYLEDFIERLIGYSFYHEPPPVWLRSKNWSDNRAENDKILLTTYSGTGANKREHRIEYFKQSRDLDDRIKALNARIEQSLEVDEDTYRTLFIATIRRAALESESLLESVLREMLMLSYKPDVGASKRSRSRSPKQSKRGSGLPYQTFILTRTEHEKKVFGLGYPAIPAMTVAQLYEQRIKDGTWSHGNNSSSAPPPDEEDMETQAEERSEEKDDPLLLSRRRQMDEYRDDHRRGWGNRFNRS